MMRLNSEKLTSKNNLFDCECSKIYMSGFMLIPFFNLFHWEMFE